MRSHTIAHLRARREDDRFPRHPQSRDSHDGSRNRLSKPIPEASSVVSQRTTAQKVGRATIRDVAELAGVSTATVSNVINNTGKVSEPTRRRVRAVIQRTKWTPDIDARNLARARAQKANSAKMGLVADPEEIAKKRGHFMC